MILWLMVWIPRMRRNLLDWEMGEVCNLLSVLHGVKPVCDNLDAMVWSPSTKGIFSTKYMYNELFGSVSMPFPFKRIWNPRILSKVSFFVWNAYLYKILTLNHLQSKGWNLANRCVLCMKDAESVNHLFVHCLVAFKV